ncbi:unnamed protein product [Adineta ricciae]|uniref:DYW domain-containing protein n=2 Tax=Adineta ricciae TaxID=249248 RepID=A0A815KMN3_ADIRI|nr:unnamed protein product [Adineta ricciae]
MSNRLVYVNFKFRTLFILRQQIPCTSSTSSFSTRPRTIDPGQQMKILNDKNQFKQSIELFEREKKKNKDQLSSFIIDQALKACVQVRDFRRGQDIHQLVQHRLSADSSLVKSLIHFYMQCHDMNTAESLFHISTNKTVYICSVMMKGYIENGKSEKAIEIFKGVDKPDAVLITLLFKACAQVPSEESLNLVKNIWKKYQNTSLLDNPAFSSLLNVLMKHGNVESAENVFNQRSNKAPSMYALLATIAAVGYIDNEIPQKAIDLFQQVKNPNGILITLLFNACAQLPSQQSLDLVKSVWKKYQNTSLLDDHALTAFIDALMRCGDVKDAETLFDQSAHKVLPMYGAMMKGYIDNTLPEKAIDLFQLVKNPNEILILLLFNACAQLPSEQSLNLVKNTWKQYNTKLIRSENTLTSLIDALMKCGDAKSAESVFTESWHKSISMYGAMMKGYIKNEMSTKAIDLFKQIKDPNDVIITLLFNACAQLPSEQSLSLVKAVWKKYQNASLLHDHALTALIDAFMKCRDVKGAETIFHKLPHKVLPMYGAMMKGYLLNKTPSNALDLYRQIKTMKETQSDFFIYLLTINASAQIAIASECQAIVDDIPQHLLLNIQICNSLIDMWGKAGCVQKAEQVFTNLSSIDQVGYASMIHAYGINGMGVKAVELFHKVPRSLLADSTYVCVLNACSHAGLVDQARSIFSSIEPKTEKHYAAMMDCLSRGSLFDEAQQLIDQYELHHPPSPVMYMALLSAARNRRNKQLVENIHQRMNKLFPRSPDLITSATVLLANLYGSTGDMNKASSIRSELSRSGAKKKPGLSWTVVNGELYQFLAHDRSHPRSAEIYVELEKISRELIERGHEYDSSWITRPLAEDETIESVLCGHSEKLAIAWNFVANVDTTFIQITKNLRVCGDCHQATKLIAAIRRCRIVIRDANRIHHFDPDGHCSCNDYF